MTLPVLAYATTAIDSISDVMYGYVTADAIEVENEDGVAVYEITFWDGAEKTLLTTDKDYNLQAGDAFSYKLKDGAVDVQGTITKWVRSITKWDGEKMVFAENSSTTYKVDEDTVIIYVDTEDQVGAEGGKIVLATKSDGVNYDANVMVQNVDGDDDNILDIIFVDVKNVWTVAE